MNFFLPATDMEASMILQDILGTEEYDKELGRRLLPFIQIIAKKRACIPWLEAIFK